MESLLLFVVSSALFALFYPSERYKPSKILQRDVNIQVRGILAMLIVFHHLSSNFRFPLSEQGLPYGEVVVSIFFFFTGYGIIKQYIAKGNEYLTGFLKKRFYKLLPPFLLITLFVSIVSLISNSNLLEVGGGKNGYILIPNGWFVYVTIMYYITFYFICKFENSVKCVIRDLFFVTITWIVVCVILGLGDWWWKSCLALNIGTFYSYRETSIINITLKKRKQLIGLLSVILLLCVLPYILHTHTIKNSLIKIFQIILPFFLLLLPSIGKFNSKILSFCGIISYEIYLIHGSIIKLICCKQPYMEYYYVIPIVYFTSIIIAYLINKITRHVFRTAK